MTDYGIALHRVIRGALLCLRIDRMRRPSESEVSHLGNPSLMSLNRFNVMASRARAKLIVLVSWEVVDHLASEVEVLRESRLLKVFVEAFCDQSQQLTLHYLQHGQVQPVTGLLRWRM